MTSGVEARTGNEGPTAEQAVESVDETGLMENLSWSMAAEAVRLVSSFAAFLLLVRVYRPVDFGRLMATTALFATLFPLASVGGGWLVLQRVTKDCWSTRNALAMTSGLTVVGSLVIGSIALVLRPLILPQMPPHLFIGVAVSEMLLMGLVEVTLFAAQATERLMAKAVAWSVYGLGRAAAAGVLLVVTDDTGLGSWIAITIGLGAVVLTAAQLATVGGLVAPALPRWVDVRDGLPYSVGFGAERLLATTDNILLVRFDYVAEAGLYAAARRLMTVSLAPCMAALHAVSARLWRAGSRSIVDARRLAFRYTAYGAAYGLATIVAWLLLGDTITAVLGETYAESADIIPWLSVLPALTVLEIFAATALTGAGLHNRRVVLTVFVGALNVVLNVLWIPDAGWRGAVFASLCSSAVYVVLLWTVLAHAAGSWPTRRPDVAAPAGVERTRLERTEMP